MATARELEISTSPRATWVWASDRGKAELLQTALYDAGHRVALARGGNTERRTLDLDIGAVALEGMQLLLDVGHSFRWHPGQHPLNSGRPPVRNLGRSALDAIERRQKSRAKPALKLVGLKHGGSGQPRQLAR